MRQRKVTARAVVGVGWVFENGFFQDRGATAGVVGVRGGIVSRGK